MPFQRSHLVVSTAIAALFLCLAFALPGVAQPPASAPATEEPTDGSPTDADAATPAAGDETATPATEEAKPEDSLTPFQRFLRTSQSPLMSLEEDSSVSPTLVYAVLFVVAYLVVISIALFAWRRARKPSFWKQAVEQEEGEGRWLCRTGYEIRRKVTATFEIQVGRVVPNDATVQLVCLVDDQVRGRLSSGSAVKLSFPHLKPRSFWQGRKEGQLEVAFELIQPRDQKIEIHLDVRIEVTLGRQRMTAGLYEVTLDHAPAADTFALPRGSRRQEMGAASSQAPLPSGPSPSAAGMAWEPATSLAIGHSAPEIDELRHGQELIDQRLRRLESQIESLAAARQPAEEVAAGGVSDEALQRELRGLESRLGLVIQQRLDERPAAGGAELEPVWREVQALEQRLTQAIETRVQGGGTGAEGLRREMAATEERLVSDMRENVQLLSGGLRDLGQRLAQLEASLNQLMQRFINSERRLAQHGEKLGRLEP